MFVTNWISTTKIQKISEITNFFRHYFLSRTEVVSCFTTTQIAKELGITAQELNRSLCALHIQYYQSGQYLLYADYAHMGLAKSRTRYSAFLDPKSDGRQEKMGRAYTHTYLVWTERGRKFIHDLAHRYWELSEVYSL